MSDAKLYGYLLQLRRVDDLLDTARQLRQIGYRRLEAFTPFPVPEIDAMLPPASNAVALCMLVGGMAGGLLGYGMQYYTAVIDYPYLAGGKPMHSWQAFIPVTFELIVLVSAVCGFVAALLLNGLPRLNHPLFEVPEFSLASRDRFFILILAEDERFDRQRTCAELEAMPLEQFYPVPSQEDA